METRVEVATAANGATVEVATIIHNGHEFTNCGAIIDLAAGYVGAYVHEDIPPKTGAGYGPRNRQYASRGELRDWSGNRIGEWRHVSTWKVNRGWDTYTMRAIRATIDGDSREWHGRYGSDWSEFVNLRPS